jgi:hypothetical protein
MNWLWRRLCSHKPDRLMRELDAHGVLHFVCTCGHKVPVRLGEPEKTAALAKQIDTQVRAKRAAARRAARQKAIDESGAAQPAQFRRARR